MAHPVFLSYAWDDQTLADHLEAQLRLRGVPVWRDRRGMRWGGYNEEAVLEAIERQCCGFILLLTGSALASDFICGIEVPAMGRRRSTDPTFFAGTVVAHDDGITQATDILRERTAIDLSGALGTPLSAENLATDLRRAACAVLRSYLHAELVPNTPVTAHLETRSPVPEEDPAILHLSWSPPLAHNLDDIAEDVWSEDLLPALADIRATLEEVRAERILRVTGRPHLSAAVALGYEFRAPTGWMLDLHANGDEVITTRTEPNLEEWSIVREPSSAREDDRLVLCLHATRDVTRAMQQHCGSLPPARLTIHVRPPDGPSHRSVEPTKINPVAAAIESAIAESRTRYGVQDVHLYLACPWITAAILGWHLSSVGTIVCHEPDVARSSYRTACQLA